MPPREGLSGSPIENDRGRTPSSEYLERDGGSRSPAGVADAAQARPVSAYVLIQSIPGKRRRVRQLVQALDGVVEADQVAGPYDLIARADVADRRELGSILDQLRQANGVLRALPCIVRGEL